MKFPRIGSFKNIDVTNPVKQAKIPTRIYVYLQPIYFMAIIDKLLTANPI